MPAPTKEQLCEHEQLVKKKRELDRESRTLSARIEQLESEFASWLRSKGTSSARRFGFLVAFVACRKNVAWKQAFIDRLGADEANKLIEQTPDKKRLDVKREG